MDWRRKNVVWEDVEIIEYLRGFFKKGIIKIRILKFLINCSKSGGCLSLFLVRILFFVNCFIYIYIVFGNNCVVSD